MKYRMQLNPIGDLSLWRGSEDVSPAVATDYREAVIEFWQEIERLRGVKDQLLAALTEAEKWIYGTPDKNGAKCETKNEMHEFVLAAIARGEGSRAERGGE